MGKIRTVMQLAVILLFVFAIVSLVRSCQSDPTQMELFDRLEMMRSDMQAVISDGGRVVSYDNNRKTTFARVYLLLSSRSCIRYPRQAQQGAGGRSRFSELPESILI